MPKSILFNVSKKTEVIIKEIHAILSNGSPLTADAMFEKIFELVRYQNELQGVVSFESFIEQPQITQIQKQPKPSTQTQTQPKPRVKILFYIKKFFLHHTKGSIYEICDWVQKKHKLTLTSNQVGECCAKLVKNSNLYERVKRSVYRKINLTIVSNQVKEDGQQCPKCKKNTLQSRERKVGAKLNTKVFCESCGYSKII